MKIVAVIISIMVAILVFSLLKNNKDKKDNHINDVTWTSLEASLLSDGTNVVSRFRLGFRNDGVVVWKDINGNIEIERGGYDGKRN